MKEIPQQLREQSSSGISTCLTHKSHDLYVKTTYKKITGMEINLHLILNKKHSTALWRPLRREERNHYGTSKYSK